MRNFPSGYQGSCPFEIEDFHSGLNEVKWSSLSHRERLVQVSWPVLVNKWGSFNKNVYRVMSIKKEKSHYSYQTNTNWNYRQQQQLIAKCLCVSTISLKGCWLTNSFLSLLRYGIVTIAINTFEYQERFSWLMELSLYHSSRSSLT